MAKNSARKLRPQDIGELPQEQPSDVQKFLKNILDNWKQIVGGGALVAVCLLSYAAFQAKKSMDDIEANSLYVKAYVSNNQKDGDVEKKLALLKEAESKGTSLQLEMLYVLGEEYLHAEKFDEAKETMTRITSEHGDSEFASRAADALAFLKENDGDLEGAIADYQNIKTKWPNSLEALRSPSKIAMLQEKLGSFELAVNSYKEQITLFPESAAAKEAQISLDRLKFLHPAFFADDEEVKKLIPLEAPIEKPADIAESSALEEADPVESTVAPTEEVPVESTVAPSEGAPVESTEAPAEDAPVESTEAPAEALVDMPTAQ